MVAMSEPAKEPSRSAAPPSARPSNFAMRYKFIDASTSSPKSLASVKCHVMLECARQKKWQEQQQPDTDGEGDADIDTSGEDKPQRGERHVRRARARRQAPNHNTYGEYQDLEIADQVGLGFGADYFDKRGISSSWSPFAGHRPWESPPFGLGMWETSISLRQMIPDFKAISYRIVRIFANFAYEEGKMLFDFYANIMPSCSYGFHTRSPNAHNWYLQVFIPVAMKADLTFQNTILVHAANTQAWVKGLSEKRAALVHRARGIEMLRKNFEKHPTDVSDAAISATLSCAAVEDFDSRPERKPISWIHMRAAMQKIRARGGPAAFQQNQRMAMLINWQDYILAGYETKEPSFFYEDTPANMRSSSSQMETGTPAAEPVPSERPWFVGRMLKIAKRLGRPSWEQLNDSLLSFLTLTAEAPMLPSWENDLRHEILTAPLTSYIMPLLL
ncbi:sigma-70 region 2 family protein [Blastomyces dermatitidis ATCC 18188]|uniref:Sigma-70 region 2 family protein n=1 Tax=Ajellomyces dermatitidis (strain ATCC 18188 / CBS 674.68) TaxID=653446 RepID=F2TJB9_AJEDA|nr:sigma-70 region 2 family protein [Blastomyces dermatitidis ATCC 18188]